MTTLRMLVIIALIFIGVRSSNAFFNNHHFFDGLMLVCCGILLGFNGFYETLCDYKLARKGNNTTKILSTLYRMTISLGLIIFSIGVIVYMIYRWNNLK